MTERHAIVEVDDDGTPLPAEVIGKSGRLLLVRFPDGRTRQVDSQAVRFEIAAGGQGTSAGLFARIASALDSMQAVLPALWERCMTDGMSERTLDELLAAPEVQADSAVRYALWRSLCDDSLYFRPSGERWRPRAAEEVAETRQRRQRMALRERLTEVMADALSDALAGGGPSGVVLEDLAGREDGAAQLVEALKDAAAGLPVEPQVEAVMGAVGLRTGRSGLMADLEGVLREAGVIGRHEVLAVRREGIREAFSREVIERAEEVAGRAGSLEAVEGVLDLTDRLTFSVDSEETRDMDDALSVLVDGEGVEIGVHVICPPAVAGLGDPVVEEALRRGVTLYLPDRFVPMFPPVLAEDALSLVAGKTRRTLTMLCRLGSRGEVGDVRFVLADVRVDHNFTWDQAREALGAGGEVGEALDRAADGARWSRSARLAAGAVEVGLPEIRYRVDGWEEPWPAVRLHRYEAEDPARRLVGEWMVRFNAELGRWAQRQGLGVPYRVQESPTSMGVVEGDSLWAALMRLKGMRRARTSMEPGLHAGLGVEGYVQATSPIRRASDLLVHHVVWGALSGGAVEVDDLSGRVERVDAAVAAALSATREAERYWGLVYLKSLEGEVVEAVLVDVEPGRGRVRASLVDTLHRVKLPARFAGRVGERLAVRIEGVDPHRGRVDVRVC